MISRFNMDNKNNVKKLNRLIFYPNTLFPRTLLPGEEGCKMLFISYLALSQGRGGWREGVK
jgi:hypothetical protein